MKEVTDNGIMLEIFRDFFGKSVMPLAVFEGVVEDTVKMKELDLRLWFVNQFWTLDVLAKILQPSENFENTEFGKILAWMRENKYTEEEINRLRSNLGSIYAQKITEFFAEPVTEG